MPISSRASRNEFVSARQEISVGLQNALGRRVGNLQISLLPNAKPRIAPVPLLDLSEERDHDSSIPPIQLLEGWEYRFELRDLAVAGPFTTDRPEVFQPDTKEGRTGRLRPGSYTGSLAVAFMASGHEIGRVLLEVRSRKLNYLSEYRWMLRDIAEQMTEVVMDRFAVAQQSFSVDNTRDAVTLYERFAFLRSLITSDDFRAALGQILSRPHVAWADLHEPISPARGLRADSHSIKRLSSPGERMPWPGGRLPTLPVKVDQRRTQASTDTTPNRFVKYALETWRSTLSDIQGALRTSSPTATTARGVREVEQVLNEVDSFLASELFREVEDLRRFPNDDQVLQKRAGYRDVYRAYIQFEAAAKLSWTGGEDVYGAGQRDLAKLYEYWAFLVLAQLVSSILEIPFDFRALIEPSQHGLNVSLKTGKRCVLSGSANRSGRALSVELWFNRTFSTRSREDGAWTRDMRPDYSIIVKPGDGETASFEPVALHFDAKYRVGALDEVFGADSAESAPALGTENTETAQGATALRADLLKMHAYRDAIRRSVGAYVLYPGDQSEQIREYHEILPGLGAFALRPSISGDAQGTRHLLSSRQYRRQRGRGRMNGEGEAFAGVLRAASAILSRSFSPFCKGRRAEPVRLT